MNPSPSQSYNVIKGLQIFINDIRGCNTKEAEVKRVEKELDKIRQKLNANKALAGYEKKKNVWKLLYIYILGYNVDFGFNYAADLITSIKFSEKMTGYISMSVLFKENNPEVNIMINSIRNDLLNQNAFCQSMALGLTTNLNNAELMAAVAQDVVKFMTSFSEKTLYTVKKALICLSKIIKVKKDVHDAGTWSKYLIKIIDMKNFEVLLACGCLVLNIFQQFGPNGYEDLAMKFFNTILYKMKECPEEYIYYHIKAPWLQIKILKIIQCINPNLYDQTTINHIKEYVDYIAKKTHTITASESKYSRFYAEYCIFFEVINLIDHMNLKLHHKTFDTYVGILGAFLQDDHRKFPNKDVNTKYLALDAMAKLSKYTSGNKILKEHSNIIIGSLRDNDISIRRRALDLLFLCCTVDSVKMISKELVLYFKEDEPQLKEDVALKIAILAEKYASDFTWYIDVCLKMLEVAGDYANDDIVNRIVQIVTGFEGQEPNISLQVYACDKILKLLEKEYVFESVVKLAALLLGEFGYLITDSVKISTDENNNMPNSGGKPFEKQIDLLMKHATICSNQTLYAIFNCLMKFVNVNINLRAFTIPVYEQYLENWDPELQQRAIEYILLSKLDGEDQTLPNMSEIRSKIFEKMPLFKQDIYNNSPLMKRLQQTQTGLYTNATKEKNVSSNVNNSNSNHNNNDNIHTASTFNEGDIEKIGNSMTKSEYNGEGSQFSEHPLYQKNPQGFAVDMNRNPDDAILLNKELLTNNLDSFKSLVSNPNNTGGLIFSDQNIKIDCKIKFLPDTFGVLGIVFSFIPVSDNDKIEEIEFSLTNYSTYELLNIQISKVKYPDGSNQIQNAQIMVKVTISESFSTPPTVYFSARVGNMKVKYNFALPLVITKFLEPFNTPIETFTGMWYEYSNSSEDSYQKLDSILFNPMSGSDKNYMDFLKKLGGLLDKLQFKVYPPSDRDNFHEIEGVAIFKYQDKMKSIPVLVQASFVPSYPQEFRLSLRAKNSDIERFATLLLDIFAIIKFYVNPY